VRTVALADLVAAGVRRDPAPTPADFASYVATGVAREPSKPYLTWYDDGTGERVELSYATFANWVWKTANYLRDGLDVQPGDRVGVLLRTHWQTVAIWYAAWTAGAVVVPMTVDALVPQQAAVVFAQEDALPAVLAARASQGELIGLSLRPMAARLTAAPPGVTDYAAEVPGYGDHFPGGRVTPVTPALYTGAAETGHADAVAAATARAAELGLGPGGRLLVVGSPRTGALDWLLAPLAAGASVVLVRGADPAALPRRAADERITATLGADVPGVRRAG
jgi:uncharacterized protein (TIGR03089 family)